MKKRILIVCGLISGVICFTVAAMVINIKTIAVLDYTKQINKNIKHLKEENKKLFHEIAMETSYTRLSAKIKELNLTRPVIKQINHVMLPADFKTDDK